jgi:hypothetical protein
MRILSAGSSWNDFALGLSIKKKRARVNNRIVAFDLILSPVST